MTCYDYSEQEVEELKARLAKVEALLADSLWRVNPTLDAAYRDEVMALLGIIGDTYIIDTI
jgi:hypothetical protein